MSRGIVAAAAALGLLAAACTPTQEYHGYVADHPGEELPVQVGVDTKTSVQQRLGSPSTVATLDQTAWYYISATQQRFAYFQPRTVDRSVTVVRFDANDVVSAVDRYGVDRGRVVAYNDNKTPTRGRELGILEQIFGNIGSTPPIRTDQDPQNPRGGR